MAEEAITIRTGDIFTLLGRSFTVLDPAESWLPSEPLDIDERVYEELSERVFYSYCDDHTMPLTDFITSLEALAAKAPPGAEVVIEFGTESDYDGPSNASYEVGYFRAPTEDEKAKRRETNRKIAERDAQRAKAAEAKERKELERLKAKFGG